MKNRLQYIYSITVFLGVLVTAYSMMNSENRRPGLRSYSETSQVFRNEAAFVDPALNQLLEMEEVLAKIKKDRTSEEKLRVPTNKAGIKPRLLKRTD